MRLFTLITSLCSAFLLTPPAWAEEARIAVSSNFAHVAEVLGQAYAETSGDRITLIPASTGKLFAQIQSGAPFDAFLSADRATVAALISDEAALAGTEFTYALGRLTLWAPNFHRGAFHDPAKALTGARHIAIANPDLAPYGKAAVETMEALAVYQKVAANLVTAENINQAQTYVATGAAEMGFVASSALTDPPTGAVWQVPASLHAPIAQDAVLLRHGADNRAAKGFLAYLASPAGRALVAASGYDLP
ncbi:MAG: molybdate ABC transporter substrate-binding protein [Paracoccaceae bacterium]